jgi:hypothetical protein
MSDTFLIKGTKRYFIHKDGYVFKEDGFKKIPIPLNIIQGIPRVKVANIRYNLALLMIEYFSDNKYDNHITYTFKLKDGKLPLQNIFIKTISTDNEDEFLIFKYKCQDKATSQNCRVSNSQRIDALDVLNALRRTNFKCQYCGDALKPKGWHIDHVQPLSKFGLNAANNITPACKACNLMKGAMPLDYFLSKVIKIYNNYNTNQAPKST